MVSRKYVFVIFLMCLIILPLPGLSKDNRGIEVAAPDQAHEAIWGNYYALIIGINAYQEWNPLQTAVKDAEGWYEILTKRYGFEKENVILRTDSEATLDRIMSDLRSLATSLQSSDNLLIYFAGHGQLDDITGDGYWIPVEGKLKKPSTWISQYRIKSILSSEKIKGKNIVVVADSCYSGTMLRGGPSLLPLDNYGYQMKLEKAVSRRSRQVITSGGVEPVADGGRDGHSLFAYYFLKALKENNREVIDIENLFHTRVWKYVTEIGDQRPNVGRLKTPMDDDGQFVLIDNESIARKLELRDRKRRELEQIKTQMAEKQKLEAQRRELEQTKALMEEKMKLEAQRRELEQSKALMEAKLKIEAQRRELEQTKALMEEKMKLEAQRREIEQMKSRQKESMKVGAGHKGTKEDNKMLASIPQSASSEKVVQRVDQELLLWQSMQNTDDPSLLEAYLKKYPAGTFASLAKSKIEKLKQRTASVLSGVWRESDAPQLKLAIEGTYKKISVTIKEFPGFYSAAKSKRQSRSKLRSYGTFFDHERLKGTLAKKVRLNGKKLEFLDSSKDYDVYYKLTLTDNETLKGIRQAEGSTYKANVIYKKME